MNCITSYTLGSAVAEPLDLYFYDRYFQITRTVDSTSHPKTWSFSHGEDLVFRVGQLFRIIIEALMGVCDLCEGAATGVVNAMTGKKWTVLNRIAQESLAGGDRLLSQSFFAALRAVNPRAEVTDTKEVEEGGIVTQWIRTEMTVRTLNCLSSSHFFLKHVVSRFVQLVGGLLSLVARIIDLAIGLLALPAVLMMQGEKPLFNDLTFQGLKVTAIISDVIQTIAGVINPYQETEELPEFKTRIRTSMMPHHIRGNLEPSNWFADFCEHQQMRILEANEPFIEDEEI